MLSGIKLSTNSCSKPVCIFANIGKTLNIANATVNSGTMEMMVVKVKLLAVNPKWSLLKRSRNVQAVFFHGKVSASRIKSSNHAFNLSMPLSCHWKRHI